MGSSREPPKEGQDRPCAAKKLDARARIPEGRRYH
jgi:hypothetical protein